MRDRCADALADEVAVLVQRGVLDSRSPAADALLDLRNPPSSPRTDRVAELEDEVRSLRKEARELRERLVAGESTSVEERGQLVAHGSALAELDGLPTHPLGRRGLVSDLVALAVALATRSETRYYTWDLRRRARRLVGKAPDDLQRRRTTRTRGER